MQRFKWPSTPYISDFTEGELLQKFDGKDVVITEKLDGENTTMTRHYIHARSMDSADHPSRHKVKALWGAMRFRIPEGTYLIGENVTAKHSIYYPKIDGPFYLFSVVREIQGVLTVMPWDHVEKMGRVLELPVVPQMVRTIVFPSKIVTMQPRLYMDISRLDAEMPEGWVARVAHEFPLAQWGERSVKWVRPNHVQTDEHWMSQPVVENGRGHG